MCVVLKQCIQHPLVNHHSTLKMKCQGAETHFWTDPNTPECWLMLAIYLIQYPVAWIPILYPNFSWFKVFFPVFFLGEFSCLNPYFLMVKSPCSINFLDEIPWNPCLQSPLRWRHRWKFSQHHYQKMVEAARPSPHQQFPGAPLISSPKSGVFGRLWPFE